MTELTRTASEMFVNTARFLDAYHAMMQPLCTEAKLPPAALDIILYLANNPSYNTAKDICCHKGLKPSIVSFHVDRLVGAYEHGTVAQSLPVPPADHVQYAAYRPERP